jgi:hypothetical protein
VSVGQRRDTRANLDRIVLLRDYKPREGKAITLGDCLYAKLDIQVKCPNRRCMRMTWMNTLDLARAHGMATKLSSLRFRCGGCKHLGRVKVRDSDGFR